MKRILLALCTIIPAFAFADIIATYNNGNIEDVTVVSVGADEVVYKKGNAQKSIASSEVEGVLYDDGRFVSPPKKAAVTESFESTSDDSWAVDDAATDDSQTASSNRQKREKKERSGGNSEVGQAFKEAGSAIKDAFTTMFDAIGKKKDKSPSESSTTETDANQSSPSASDDGW
ncbi:MAG: hypothetical protein IJ581_01390 [Paludibacteraceae bacterium]|nr:hypothetical protein [Paludibacteraceae bacterium]